MQALDRVSKCHLARCSRQLLGELHQPLSWRHADPLSLYTAVEKKEGDVMLSPQRAFVIPSVPLSSPLRNLVPLDLRFPTSVDLVDLSALDNLPRMHGIQVDVQTRPDMLQALLQLSSMQQLRCVCLDVYDEVFTKLPPLRQLLSALPLRTLHLFVWQRRRRPELLEPHCDALRVLGNALPLLEELHCDLDSWKVGLARSSLARRIRRLGLPLWQRDKPVSSYFSGLESPLPHLLALECTERLEDLTLFGVAHMEKRAYTVPPLMFRNAQCAPIPVAPVSLPQEGGTHLSVGLSSLHSLRLLGFHCPETILAKLASSSPPSELRLLLVCFHRRSMDNPSDTRRMLVQHTTPLRARCHSELEVAVHADSRDPKGAQFARVVGKGAGPHERFRVSFCSGC
jgi:hypothetical protein